MYNNTPKLPPINQPDHISQNKLPPAKELLRNDNLNMSTPPSHNLFSYNQTDSMDKPNQRNDLPSHPINKMPMHNMPGKQISHSMPIHVQKTQNKPVSNIQSQMPNQNPILSPNQMGNIQSPMQQQMSLIPSQSNSNINSTAQNSSSSSSSMQQQPPSSQPPSSQPSMQNNQYNYNQPPPSNMANNQLNQNAINQKGLKHRQKPKPKPKIKGNPPNIQPMQPLQPAPSQNHSINPNILSNIQQGQNMTNIPLPPQNNSMGTIINGRNPMPPMNNASNSSIATSTNQSIPLSRGNNNSNNNGPMNQNYPNSAPPMNGLLPSHNRPQQMPNNDININNSQNNDYRPLNVKDALVYLDQVKEQFNNSPQVYNQFLDIMKEFKSENLSTPGVIERVSTLFKDHPNLIIGFNTFLPPGYRIEPPANGQETVKVITPNNQMNMQPNHMMMNMNPQQSMQNNNQQPQNQIQFYNNNNNDNNQQNFNSNDQNMKMMPSTGNSFNNSNNMNLNKQKSPLNSQRRSLPNIMPMNNNMQQPMPYNNNMMNNSNINNNNNNNNRDMPYSNRKRAPVEFNHAINFVNKIKTRFINEPGKYKQFLEILQIYQKEQKPIQEVYSQVQVLFQNELDLLEEFKNFLPDSTQASIITNNNNIINKQMRPIQAKMQSNPSNRNIIQNNENINNNMQINNNYQQSHQQIYQNSINMHPSQKPMYQMDNNIPNNQNMQQNMNMPIQNQIQPQPNDIQNHNKRQGPYQINQIKPHKRALQPSNNNNINNNNNMQFSNKNQNMQYSSHPPNKKYKISKDEKQNSSEDMVFFNKARQVIGNKADYDKFLQVLNQFSQEIINSKTLVEKVGPYLGRSPELFKWFKSFIKYNDEETISNIPAVKSINDENNTYEFVGKSYYKAPEKLSSLKCSGRDELCNSVLNDKYTSRSISINGKTPNFIPINIFDEVLYNCEEERYKFDYNLSICRHAIEIFELMGIKLSNLPNEEKERFKFFNSINETSRIICRKAIKKLYTKEYENDIVNAVNENPNVAIPLLLKRLRQKEDEWSHFQREWNKLWCQINKNNINRALDHLASSYKINEKLNLNNQIFINQIEKLYKEGLVHHHTEDFTMDEESYDDNKKYHYSLKFLDSNVLQDLHILIRQYLKAENINNEDYNKVENFFEKFLSEFFSETFDISAEEDIEIDRMLRKELNPSEVAAMGINESNGKSVIKAFHKIGENDKNEANTTFTQNVEPTNNSVSVSITTRETENGGITTTYYHTNKNLALNIEVESSQSEMDIDNSSFIGSKNEDIVNAKKKRNERNMDVEDWRRRARIGHIQHQNESYIFYADSHFYCFFRLLHVLYRRLMHVKEISLLKIKNPSSIKKYPDIYKDKLQLIMKLIDKKCTQLKFEEESKKLLGNEAYKLFTINKIIAKTVEEIDFILKSDKTEELLNISRKYHQLAKDGDPKTINEEYFKYLLEVNNLLNASQIYKMEYNTSKKMLKIKLIKANDIVNMKNISIQLHKWKDFIKSFCLLQVDNNEILKSKKIRTPYMKRNLKSNLEYVNKQQFPEYSIYKSGLKFLICPKNYQIKYVMNSEDYYIKYGSKVENLQKKEEIIKKMKKKKFLDWLDTKAIQNPK
ncbi:hypothetical protein BCR36DRAFT_581393 [Piromyces finnis]|uniref:Histone deacetylase interacting domain-containing protein n=1 Tax=Piromyces finnis TaxID=1754191 RepID=A0A1Y1VHW5_9FUNG|nr:hypothetical protein BCR36DRAFT_581393 [Piromyces finnis]|eukprot:ORX55361.1 hypothetical protein BCR36DRAFT_581393 [Piromyces finnis]